MPGLIGEEFIMTKGHQHPVSANGDTYAEIYEVWHGKALYLQQGINKATGEFEAIATIANPGDKVILLPDYSHRTINISDVPLVMANWICLEVGGKDGGKSHYTVKVDFSEIEAKNGYTYHVIKTEDNKIALRHNKAYGPTPAVLKLATPIESISQLGLSNQQPMYPLLYTRGDTLTSFLKNAKGLEGVFEKL